MSPAVGPTAFPGFPSQTLKFLKDLSNNNDRDWFNERKPKYEQFVREPALALITAMQKPLDKQAPMLEAIPKKVGGSLMRIYRDTRFSKDKTPYKTNVGIHFRHEQGSNVHAPGVYLHLEPSGCFMGAGIWHPEKEALLSIRQFLAEHPDLWKKAVYGKKFREAYELTGDRLKRPPAGFDKEHPYIEDLKRKDFIGISPLTKAQVESPELIKVMVQKIKAADALMRFLCDALGIPF